MRMAPPKPPERWHPAAWTIPPARRRRAEPELLESACEQLSLSCLHSSLPGLRALRGRVAPLSRVMGCTESRSPVTGGNREQVRLVADAGHRAGHFQRLKVDDPERSTGFDIRFAAGDDRVAAVGRYSDGARARLYTRDRARGQLQRDPGNLAVLIARYRFLDVADRQVA